MWLLISTKFEITLFRTINSKMEAPKLGMLSASSSIFFLCDIQEKFKNAMLHFDDIVQSASILVIHTFSFFYPTTFLLSSPTRFLFPL